MRPADAFLFPHMFAQDLATAGTTKRPTCCVLVMTKPAKGELEGEVKEKLKTDYDQVTSAMF
jgi:H/ACA ribonucleoprotein complex subunit 2